MKNEFDTNSRFFSQTYAQHKNKRNFGPQGFQIEAFQQSFAQCLWKRPILEGSLIKKRYLNHELGPRFVCLSSLAYKLMNILIFETNYSQIYPYA